MANGRKKPRGTAAAAAPESRARTMQVADLMQRAAPYNPRKIEEAELEALRRSLRTFGCVEPIVFNERTGQIVGGHQRVRAAEAEGWTELPVFVVDLDETAERQLNLALNKISGTWDEPLLSALLVELDLGGADMTLTGFSSDEIEKLVGNFDAAPGEMPDSLGDANQEEESVSFVLAHAQASELREALEVAREQLRPEDLEENRNKNGASLMRIVRCFTGLEPGR